MRRIAGKLIRLSAGDWRDLAGAQRALLEAQLSVWLRPRGSLVGRNATQLASIEPDPPSVTDAGVASLVRALDRAARFGPIRPQCLVRAIALARFLASRGYPGGGVKVGVRRQGQSMVAHAWVEYDGVVIGEDDVDVTDFVTMPDVEVSL